MIALRTASFKLGARNPPSSTLRSSIFHRLRRNVTSNGKAPKEIPLEAEEAREAIPIDIPPAVWYQRLGPVTVFFGWFGRMQSQRPYTVQICTTLTTYLCGDILAQDIGGELYDPKRTLRMLLIGSIASIPGYKWFLFLGNNFNYSSRVGSIALKTLIQQAVFTPVFNTYFFGMQAILTGNSPSGVIHRIQETVPTSIKNSAKFWPIVTAFSFAFISLEYRFMFSGIFAVVWQTYLSYLNRRAEKTVLGTEVETG